MNNNNFSNHTFTWVLEDRSTVTNANKNVKPAAPQEDPSQPQPQQQPQEPFGLSDADLFQFLLGEEVQQAAMTDNYPASSSNNADGDSSTGEDVSMAEYTTSKEPSKNNVTNNGPPASSTGRLDFRPIRDYIPESQLKAMTSKERRQLRNKISARNFRNRRKEYIGTLEDELNQQKAENNRLKLELKWARTKMDELQSENDKLRVELVLGGMVLPTPAQIQQQTSPYFDSTSMISSTLNLSNTSSSSSDESTLSSPPNLFSEFPDNWDFVLPEEQTIQNDTYLSHALVPHWNINQVLSKETTPIVATPNLFQQYPLLAPALMSIVVTHTMTMSADDILATAKLNPLPTTIEYNNKKPFSDSTIMTDKEAKAIWDILEPLTLMNERNSKIKSLTKEETVNDDNVTVSNGGWLSQCPSGYYMNSCPLAWLQNRVCRYLCEFAANHCTTYIKQEEEQAKKKFVLCRQFEKAKRYVTACQ